MNEAQLGELFEFIAGRGKYSFTRGGAMFTYPGRDENRQRLHEGCLELERRGLIRRHEDEPGYVSWVEVTKPHTVLPKDRCR